MRRSRPAVACAPPAGLHRGCDRVREALLDRGRDAVRRRLPAPPALVAAALLAALLTGTEALAQSRMAPNDLPAVTQRRGVWNDSLAVDGVTRAIEARGSQLRDSTLGSYQALARGFLAFLAQLGDGFTDPPRVVQTEQLALQVAWWQPGRSAQQLVGRRDTTLLPANVGYYRDRYGVVLDNLPDRIRLGDGFDVADVPHPLAAGADSLYEYQIGETFTMRLPDRVVLVDEVRFRPRDVRGPAAVGSVYLDRESSAVVRLSLTFTRAAILDARIETLVVTLENGLVRGRWWLPRRQEVEVVRRSTWLDVPARGIVRGHWEVSGYEVNERIDEATLGLPRWSSVPRDSLVGWAFDGRVIDVLPPDMRVGRDDDVRAAQERAEAAVRAAALARPMTLAAAGRGVSDAIRHSRTEGLALGFGLAHRWAQAVTLSGRVRYGIDDGQPKGRLALDRRPPLGGPPVAELFVERQYRELGARERAGVTNSLASLFFGSDYTTPVDLRAVGATWRPRGSARLRVRAAWEEESPLAVVSRPLSGQFAATLPAWSVRGPRVDATLEGRRGVTGEHTRAWAVRLIGAAARGDRPLAVPLAAATPSMPSLREPLREAMAHTDRVQPLAVRLESDVRAEWPLRRGLTAAASVQGGVTTGRDLPPQWLQFAGGPWSGPGYGFHAFVGQAIVSPRVELRVPVPFPSVPLGRYGRAPARAQLVPFAQAVLLSGTSRDPAVSPLRDGVYPAVGLGALLFYDLLRVDVSRGLHQGQWRFSLDVDRLFWSIL
jgi:hypothetical protein